MKIKGSESIQKEIFENSVKGLMARHYFTLKEVPNEPSKSLIAKPKLAYGIFRMETEEKGPIPLNLAPSFDGEEKPKSNEMMEEKANQTMRVDVISTANDDGKPKRRGILKKKHDKKKRKELRESRHRILRKISETNHISKELEEKISKVLDELDSDRRKKFLREIKDAQNAKNEPVECSKREPSLNIEAKDRRAHFDKPKKTYRERFENFRGGIIPYPFLRPEPPKEGPFPNRSGPQERETNIRPTPPPRPNNDNPMSLMMEMGWSNDSPVPNVPNQGYSNGNAAVFLPHQEYKMEFQGPFKPYNPFEEDQPSLAQNFKNGMSGNGFQQYGYHQMLNATEPLYNGRVDPQTPRQMTYNEYQYSKGSGYLMTRNSRENNPVFSWDFIESPSQKSQPKRVGSQEQNSQSGDNSQQNSQTWRNGEVGSFKENNSQTFGSQSRGKKEQKHKGNKNNNNGNHKNSIIGHGNGSGVSEQGNTGPVRGNENLWNASSFDLERLRDNELVDRILARENLHGQQQSPYYSFIGTVMNSHNQMGQTDQNPFGLSYQINFQNQMNYTDSNRNLANNDYSGPMRHSMENDRGFGSSMWSSNRSESQPPDATREKEPLSELRTEPMSLKDIIEIE